MSIYTSYHDRVLIVCGIIVVLSILLGGIFVGSCSTNDLELEEPPAIETEYKCPHCKEMVKPMDFNELSDIFFHDMFPFREDENGNTIRDVAGCSSGGYNFHVNLHPKGLPYSEVCRRVKEEFEKIPKERLGEWTISVETVEEAIANEQRLINEANIRIEQFKENNKKE
jgi:hypothetical protein